MFKHPRRFKQNWSLLNGGGAIPNAAQFDGFVNTAYSVDVAGYYPVFTFAQIHSLSLWTKIVPGQDPPYTGALFQIGDNNDVFNAANLTVWDEVPSLSVNQRFRVDCLGNPGQTFCNFTGALQAPDKWRHILVRMNANTGVAQVAIDDTVVLNSSPGPMALDAGTVATAFIGAAFEFSSVSYFCAASVSELWYDINDIGDLTVAANRRKFITASGAPAALGANGQGPNGTPPLIYQKNPAGTYGVNSGTGGNLTVSGTLTSVSGPTIAGQP